jgi:cysteinyl-tRNA synthetase, unknown class
MTRLAAAIIVASCAACAVAQPRNDPEPEAFAGVKSWAYVIQKQTEGDRLARLAASGYDVAVIDDPRTIVGTESHDARADVARLHATKGAGTGRAKTVIAYVDIGEAEDYRTYWKPDWSKARPSFIVAEDPDGWAGNYPVAYWSRDWYAVIDEMIDAVVADGYDGIYLDWIEAAFFEPVLERAAHDGVDARAEMVQLVAHLRERARRANPRFLVVAQNAVAMRFVDGWLALLDAEAQEQIAFDGAADVYGNDPRQGDCRLPSREGDPPPADNPAFCADVATMDMSTEEYVTALRDFRKAGLPVFVVDYALDPMHAREAYALHAKEGFVGLVTMRSLEDLTRTPPPGQ